MTFIADFHIHSHHSIATSKKLIPEYLDYWARLKGITVVGTGDFTHPGWLAGLKQKLEPAEEGLYRLKREYKSDPHLQTPFSDVQNVRFMLTAEVSTIYKKAGRVRKVHNIIFAPDFSTAEHIQDQLARIGNISSDGRPILGLDARNLLEIALQASDRIFFVPAHIWTPWFSVLGSKSGFDTIEECYGDLTGHIHAVETGLSSDPPMNWMCSFLDDYTLISNSDAHSPEKLGREANLFDCNLSFTAITEAMKAGSNGFRGTIEFFPEEGKYHFDGHRNCDVVMNPLESEEHGNICPVCGKKLTVGVLNRVVQLADRPYEAHRSDRPAYYPLVSLKDILSERLKAGRESKRVNQAYFSLLEMGGSEINILHHLPLDVLGQFADDTLVEGIYRMRTGRIQIRPGYDGNFGTVSVFNEERLF